MVNKIVKWINVINLRLCFCVCITQAAFFAIAQTQEHAQEAVSDSQDPQDVAQQDDLGSADLGSQDLGALAKALLSAMDNIDSESLPGSPKTREEKLKALMAERQNVQEESNQLAIEQEKQKEQAINSLPQNLKDAIQKADEAYQKFLEQVDIRTGIINLCSKIEVKIDKYSAENRDENTTQNIQKIKTLFQKLKSSIKTGGIEAFPRPFVGKENDKNDILELSGIPGMSELFNGETNPFANDKDTELKISNEEDLGEKVTFSTAEFNELLGCLKDVCEKIWPMIKDSKKEQRPFVGFRNIALAIRNSNAVVLNNNAAIKRSLDNEIIKRYLNYIEPRQNKTYDTIKAASTEFNAEYKRVHKTVYKPAIRIALEQARPIEDFLTKEQLALDETLFSFKELFDSKLKNILAFAALKSEANSVFSGTKELFKSISFVYDLTSHFVVLIKKENEQKLLKNRWKHGARAYDWGFRFALAAWYLKYKSTSNAAKMLSASLMNGTSIDGLSDSTMNKNFETWLKAFFMWTAPTYYNETKLRYPGISKQFEPVVTSMIHVGATALYNEAMHEHELKNDALFKRELLKCGDEFGDFGYLYVESFLYRLMPNVLDKCHRYSLGIIRPGFFKHFAREMTPALLYYYNPVSDFANYNEFELYTNNHDDKDAKKNFKKTGLFDTYDQFSQEIRYKVDGTTQMQFPQYCLERCILSWTLSNIGSTIAGKIAKHTSKPLFNSAFKLLDTCANKSLSILNNLNLVSNDSKEWWNAIKDGVLEQKDDIYSKLLLYLQFVFIPRSPIHEYGLRLLKARGEISTEDLRAPEKCNKALLNKLLEILRYYDAASMSESTQILNKFDQCEKLKKEKAKSGEIDFTMMSPGMDVNVLKELRDIVASHIISSIVKYPITEWIINPCIINPVLSKWTISDGVRFMKNNSQSAYYGIRSCM